MDELQRSKLRANLKDMLAKIAPGGQIDSLPIPTSGGGLEGFESAGEPHPNAKSGLLKMAENRGHEVNDDELYALEAIVMPQNRPVVFVRGDDYDSLGAPWTSLNSADVKARLNPLLALIGRIEVPNLDSLPYAGTGFVVGKNLLMTNRHVAAIFAQGLGPHIRYQAGDAAIDFKRQIDTTENDRSAYLGVRRVEMIHPYWDMAILRVDGLPLDRALNLSVRNPDELIGQNIVTVGYPALDSRNNISLQDRIFQGTYNVKRLQPGKLRPREEVDSFKHKVNALTHDSSTLGGNSGSAIIDVERGEVVALHFSGEYLKGNHAVPMYELARDRRVTSLKLNFQGSLGPTNDWEPYWQNAENPEDVQAVSIPAARQDTPDALLQSPSSAIASASLTGAVSPTGSSANWTIPLRITLTLGQPLQDSGPADVRSASSATPPDAAEIEGVKVDKDYAKRPGYDPNFLEETEVPLPALSKKMEADTAVVSPAFQKKGDRFELAYYNYSVYMNKRRRTAWFSAANVDGGHRHDIGKREGDRWFIDPRIDRSEQLGQEAYEHGIDRGHLTRREDTAWGATAATALKSNNDTFHFTNCALQASMFNRGKDRWQGLEQFLLEKHAKKDKRRMVVITGPVFATNDPAYRNSNMDYTVRCPIQFWKLCVLIRENGTPSATAFLLGQEEITDLPGFEEAFDVAATQVKVADLEKKTGLSFGDLKKHDHFAQKGAPGTLELPAAGGKTQQVNVIRIGEDIVV